MCNIIFHEQSFSDCNYWLFLNFNISMLGLEDDEIFSAVFLLQYIMCENNLAAEPSVMTSYASQ